MANMNLFDYIFARSTKSVQAIFLSKNRRYDKVYVSLNIAYVK